MTGTLLGPLHTKGAIKEYTDGLAEIKKQGGRVLFGGNVVDGPGNFVQPTIVEIDPAAPIVKTELFVPILYVMKFKVRARVVAKTLTSLRVRRWMVWRWWVGLIDCRGGWCGMVWAGLDMAVCACRRSRRRSR